MEDFEPLTFTQFERAMAHECNASDLGDACTRLARKSLSASSSAGHSTSISSVVAPSGRSDCTRNGRGSAGRVRRVAAGACACACAVVQVHVPGGLRAGVRPASLWGYGAMGR